MQRVVWKITLKPESFSTLGLMPAIPRPFSYMEGIVGGNKCKHLNSVSLYIRFINNWRNDVKHICSYLSLYQARRSTVNANEIY